MNNVQNTTLSNVSSRCSMNRKRRENRKRLQAKYEFALFLQGFTYPMMDNFYQSAGTYTFPYKISQLFRRWYVQFVRITMNSQLSPVAVLSHLCHLNYKYIPHTTIWGAQKTLNTEMDSQQASAELLNFPHISLMLRVTH